MIIDNQEVYELSEQELGALSRLENEAAARLRTALQESFNAIERSVRGNWEAIQAKGYLALLTEIRKLDQIRATLEILNPEAAGRIRTEFESIFREGAIAGDTLAQALIRARSDNTVRTFVNLPVLALVNITNESMTRLKNHTDTFRDRATAILLQGISQGWGPERVRQQLRTQLDIVAHRAETIQRTETLSALNAASMERYKAERVAFVQFIPTGDDRTCPVCADRAGEIYRINEAPQPPIHPRCRCVLSPADDMTQGDREWSARFAAEVKALAGGQTDPSPAAFETTRPRPVETFG